MANPITVRSSYQGRNFRGKIGCSFAAILRTGTLFLAGESKLSTCSFLANFDQRKTDQRFPDFLFSSIFHRNLFVLSESFLLSDIKLKNVEMSANVPFLHLLDFYML